MAILAECDICGNQHRVRDALAGAVIHCSDCGVNLTVSRSQLITPDAFIEEGGRLRPREIENHTGIWTWLIAFVVANLVLLAFILCIWAFFLLTQSVSQVADRPQSSMREISFFSENVFQLDLHVLNFAGAIDPE